MSSDGAALAALSKDGGLSVVIGGFYFCEVEHQHDGWIAFIEWLEAAGEADRFFDANNEWLPADESTRMMAALPLHSLRLERLIDEDRVTELLERESLESIATGALTLAPRVL